MADWLFYLFGALAVLSGVSVSLSRNPVNAAMSMIVCFVAIAGLFVLLETFFLAVTQVLVYAGAIVVLFLFIIMLIDAEHAPRPSWKLLVPGLGVLALLLCGSWLVSLSPEAGPFPVAGAETAGATSMAFGKELFARQVLPFQVAGFLLLVAMIGVVVISRRSETGAEGGQP